MREFIGDDTLIVNADSEHGVKRRVTTLVVVNSLAAALSLLVILAPKENAGEVLLPLLLVDVLALALSIVLVAIDSRGTWTFDKQGIEHRRPIRPTLSLNWSDIARVLWFSRMIALEGKGTRIWLRLDLLTKDDANAVKARIESRLRGQFDLGTAGLWSESPSRDVARIFAYRVALGFAMAAVFLGVMVYLAYCPFRSEDVRTIALLVWTPVGSIACIAPLAFMVGVQNGMIDPNHPWRVRRSPDHAKHKPSDFDARLSDATGQ